MNRIDKKFKELKAKRKKAFIAYICAGDPDIQTTKKLILELEKSGVDIIELGVPFSDPLADGPTIQRASQRALRKGVTIKKILSMVASLREETEVPLILMSYYNPIFSYGVKRFVEDAKARGVDGVIVPDLSPEEAGALISISRKRSFCTIFLVAPTSTKKRIALIAQKSTGFIYYVSLTGVTGSRKRLPPYIQAHIRYIKGITDRPVCVGFGVSAARQVRSLTRFSDGVIVGSAIIDRLEKALPRRQRIIHDVTQFVKGLMKGL